MSYPILLASGYADIVTQRSTLKILLAFLLCLLGFCAMILALFSTDDSVLSMSLLVLGVMLILWGCYRLFWCSQLKIYRPSGSKVFEKSLFFDTKCKESLLGLIEKGNVNQENIPHSSMNGSLRLDTLYSLDRRLLAVQLFEFVPHSYVPLTPPFYILDKADSRLWSVVMGK